MKKSETVCENANLFVRLWENIRQWLGFICCARCGKWHKSRNMIFDGSWYICVSCALELMNEKILF